MSKKFDVIVVGELNVDLILGHIDGFPEVGKEKLADSMTLTLGSSSAIMACNLCSLGAKVAFLGKIGTDIFGDLMISSLQNKGVNTDYIIRDVNLKTGATIALNYDEDRAMVTHPGAMNHLTIDDISVEKLKNANHLHYSSYYIQPGMKKDVDRLFKMAKEAGLTTSLDMQWDPDEKWDLDYQKVLQYVDIFLPNKQELFLLTNESNIAKAVNKLSSQGIIAVKMGHDGSSVWLDHQETRLPAYKNNQVVDAIGAGDSFNAGFVYQYVQKKSIQECQTFGNLCGAINTTQAGGTAAFTSYEDVMNLAKERFNYKMSG